MSKCLRIATWNTEWRRPESRYGIEILKRLKELAPDVLCLTETHADFLSDWAGSVADGGSDPLEVKEPRKRKVLIWTRWDWSKTSREGVGLMRRGCFITSTTETPLGPLTAVGVVIPYHMADVKYGTRDKKMWESHGQFLDGLQILSSDWDDNSIIFGDYNQRLPVERFPPEPYRHKLQKALIQKTIATSGMIGPDGKRSNDHIAYGRSWQHVRKGLISNIAEDRRELSDHFGVWIDLQRASLI